MKELLESDFDSSTKLFVSSDTADGVKLMLEAFPDQVVAQQDSTYSRNSLEGLQAGALDLLMLADTDQIVCTSVASTFSSMASDIRAAKTKKKSAEIIYLPEFHKQGGAGTEEETQTAKQVEASVDVDATDRSDGSTR